EVVGVLLDEGAVLLGGLPHRHEGYVEEAHVAALVLLADVDDGLLILVEVGHEERGLKAGPVADEVAGCVVGGGPVEVGEEVDALCEVRQLLVVDFLLVLVVAHASSPTTVNPAAARTAAARARQVRCAPSSRES